MESKVTIKANGGLAVHVTVGRTGLHVTLMDLDSGNAVPFGCTIYPADRFNPADVYAKAVSLAEAQI